MAYKALYRAYRPQSFEEVAGQKHIVRTLKNALVSNKIAHAYLFCGPRGTGKTTMAKLFAKALNCEEGIGHQCNKCSNCVEVTEGTHPDVIEIDAASNNGVEQVRELIDKVNYLPIKGKYKVYIIDEVHMMTANAFNALLKTLEEPPAHVIFILATTEPHNILPTIVSRCQRYDFTKVSDADIFERMVEILQKEDISYDEKAVNAIISLADGGVRDALSILDQILAYSGSSLKEEDVYALFGLASLEEKLSFIKAIYNGDVATCLTKINAFSEGGVDLKRLTNDLLDILKDVLIIKKTKDDSQLTVLNLLNADELANMIDMRFLNEMIGTFLKAQSDYKTVANIKTMFEVIVLRLATSNDAVVETVKKVEPIPQKVEVKETKPEIIVEQPMVEEEPMVEEKETVLVKEPKTEIKPEPVAEKEETPEWHLEENSPKQELETEGDHYELDDETIIKFMVLGEKEERKELMTRWNELDAYISHPSLGKIVALIKDGRPFIVTKEAIILEYDFVKLADKLNVKTNQNSVSEVLSKMIGRDVFVYGISRSESVRLIKAFNNLRQISKLPRASEISIKIEEIKK
ncbi:MAG: DNA polymerase III subunit gamma/tau [Bacilli bacterium]|nr:DNA polymerase III subunit gamma/tau [Bacilli bacterium]